MSINVEWETFKIKFGHFTKIRIAANLVYNVSVFFLFLFFSAVLKFLNFIEKNHGKMCATQRHVHCFVILIRIRYAFRIRLDIIVVESIQFFFVAVVIVVEHTMWCGVWSSRDGRTATEDVFLILIFSFP